MIERFVQNPILTKKDILPNHEQWVVECVLNPGVFRFQNKIWLLLRVAERPIQKEGYVSFPIQTSDGNYEIKQFKIDDPNLNLSDARMVAYDGKTYLSTISHLRLVCSDDGIHFHEPKDISTIIFGSGALETFGIEDCRVSLIDSTYYLTYTQVSENGVGVGMMHTKDWITFTKEGMMIPPHNIDCALFEEKINDKYFCFHRPSGIDLGGNFIWIASSPDLLHWGNHQCILHTREDMWDSARVGAGAAPIRTDQGWLAIYHGANIDHHYGLGAILLDINDPSIVIARSSEPILSSYEMYELNGFFGHVVFTNGHILNGDDLTIYYGASDEVICGARVKVSKILEHLLVSKN
jgi:beta-1,2-mannobiose phosphorylase / 1,2-beta-oligomannan phosphorylase